ncbi:uncharacterized protein LOC108135020 [Drosophila elegans]|uniref:uncharacterized protein LOC108135020 n=1 Tax=Drosophila elegans TaxID=30023 RepID=UPI0007E5CBD5|nr:uncharacterized protein LOC108135020 [Drosophila elegans]
MSNMKDICDGGQEPKWRSDVDIEKLPKHKMITSQECMLLKRDLESDGQDDFEVSPMILCLMLTLLLFVIGFWIWLISKSCLFAQPDEVRKKRNAKRRLSGGNNPRANNTNVRILDISSQTQMLSLCKLERDDSNSSRNQSCPLKVCNTGSYGGPSQCIPRATYCNLMVLPTTSPSCTEQAAEMESQTVTEATTGSSMLRSTESSPSQSCPRLSTIIERNELEVPTTRAEVGSPLMYGSMPSNFGREVPKRKYSIKWTNFLRQGRKDHCDTQSPQ